MALVKPNKLLAQAQHGGYAVGAFNAENMEMVQAIIAAAQELNAPVIIQTTPSTVAYGGAALYQKMVCALASKASIPIVMHLDHGDSFECCANAMEAGYTSVMIDGSKLPFAENVALTSRVVAAAKQVDVSVEGELGTVGGKEDNHSVSGKDALYTNPNQAQLFATRTEISSLAIAIGTAHGFYQGEPKLDFDRLQEIRKRVTLPLVLHGASGVSDTLVRRAIELGICKVNVATELRVAYSQGIRQTLEDLTVFDPKKYGAVGREMVKKAVKDKIFLCNSAGKA